MEQCLEQKEGYKLVFVTITLFWVLRNIINLTVLKIRDDMSTLSVFVQLHSSQGCQKVI